MTDSQLLGMLQSLGGAASEDDLLAVIPAGARGLVLDQLRGMEGEGLVDCDVRISYVLTEAGRNRLPTSPPPRPNGEFDDERNVARKGEW